MALFQKFPFRQLNNMVRSNPHLLKTAIKCIPDKSKVIHIPNIGPFEINCRKNRSFWLRDPMEMEKFPLSFLQCLITPGSIFYDIGANIGLYARCAVECFQAGRVVAFEPMDDNRILLHNNVQYSSSPEKITVLPYAIADFEGESTFQIDDNQSATAVLDVVTNGQAALGRRQLGLEPLVQQVQCRTLDSIIEEGSFPEPDVIKIDVEGAEMMVLNGAEGYLRERMPKLMVENHGEDKARSVCRFLLDMGYHIAGCCHGQYQRFDYNTVEMIKDHYSAQFIMAAADVSDLPESLEMINFQNVEERAI